MKQVSIKLVNKNEIGYNKMIDNGRLISYIDDCMMSIMTNEHNYSLFRMTNLMIIYLGNITDGDLITLYIREDTRTRSRLRYRFIIKKEGGIEMEGVIEYSKICKDGKEIPICDPISSKL